ncbi:MAG: hypothetical protein K0S09_1129 [Sphingobacteriaceae bacterium]|nr:hypothetical protein [Sphingobacteriaceae bacterium]
MCQYCAKMLKTIKNNPFNGMELEKLSPSALFLKMQLRNNSNNRGILMAQHLKYVESNIGSEVTGIEIYPTSVGNSMLYCIKQGIL